MCLSALIESEAYKAGGDLVNIDVLTSLTESLIHLHKLHDFMRESIQAVFSKLLRNLPPETHGAKVLDKIVTELLVVNKKQDGPLKDYLYEHLDHLSLFLSLKHLYLASKLKDQSPKLIKVLGLDVLSDDSDFQKLKTIVGRSVHIYPRLHGSLAMLIDEIYLFKHPNSDKLRLKEIKKLCKTVFEDHFFDE